MRQYTQLPRSWRPGLCTPTTSAGLGLSPGRLLTSAAGGGGPWLTPSDPAKASIRLGRTLFSSAGPSQRSLTSSQVATALRPFYFLVHPDLFGRFPKERGVNENSLKILKSYLDETVAGADAGAGARPQSRDIKFYLKPRGMRDKHRSHLKSVTFKLKKEMKLQQTISHILESSNLPSSYLDSLPVPHQLSLEEQQQQQQQQQQHTMTSDNLEEAYESHQMSRGLHATDMKHPLPTWLNSNVESARGRLAQSSPKRLDIERIQDELSLKWGLEKVVWDCDWGTDHRRGALDSFRFLTESHPEIEAILKGRTVVFGWFSGVSLDGHIVLNSGEVRYNWLHVIKTAPETQATIELIPQVEKSLSHALRDIKIVRRTYQPLTLVDDYRLRLRQVLTSLGDFFTQGNKWPDPPLWPNSLNELELCVEAEASPLMVSPSGQFIVPASCPAFLLVGFITDNWREALDRLKRADSEINEAEALIIRCINDLGLIQLDRDHSITTKDMIECCVRLLQHASSIRHLTHGNHLLVTRYYSVLSDGIICIPWNWRES